MRNCRESDLCARIISNDNRYYRLPRVSSNRLSEVDGAIIVADIKIRVSVLSNGR